MGKEEYKTFGSDPLRADVISCRTLSIGIPCQSYLKEQCRCVWNLKIVPTGTLCLRIQWFGMPAWDKYTAVSLYTTPQNTSVTKPASSYLLATTPQNTTVTKPASSYLLATTPQNTRVTKPASSYLLATTPQNTRVTKPASSYLLATTPQNTTHSPEVHYNGLSQLYLQPRLHVRHLCMLAIMFIPLVTETWSFVHPYNVLSMDIKSLQLKSSKIIVAVVMVKASLITL